MEHYTYHCENLSFLDVKFENTCLNCSQAFEQNLFFL